MSQYLDNVYAAVLAGVEADTVAAILENWDCLNQDEKRFVKVLRAASGGGGGVAGSEGGNDADDAGLAAVYHADGALAATNSFTLYEGVGHVNYWRIDTAGVDGERDVSVVNGSGQLPLWVVDIPANSADGGEPGMMAYDGDFLYICVAADTWRRADLTVF